MSLFVESSLSCFKHRTAVIGALLTTLLASSTASLSAGALVGALPGDISVNNTGSATYSMPISLPAGVAGMAPEVGINYDSSGGNGLLGMGFGLDGLSAIYRTPTTIEQDDDLTDGIDFDSNDRFSLDGQRLVCVAGTYGAAGSSYRTEIDSFVRVTALGQIMDGGVPLGPDSFIVETKAGLTKTYGSSNSTAMLYDSNIYSVVPKVSWLLEKIEDTNGNEINFIYVEDPATNAKYISEINYGVSGQSLKVVFEYQNRDDTIPSFLRGVNFSTSQRLYRIRVYSGGAEQYRYTLSYDYSPQRFISRLRNCLYTDVPTGDTIQTNYDWHDESALTSFLPKSRWFYSSESLQNTTLFAEDDGKTAKSMMIDMNGDGLLDKVDHYDYDDGGGQGLYVSINNGSGFDAKSLWFYEALAERNYPRWYDQGHYKSDLRDINADGLPDKIDSYNNDVYEAGMWVAINTGEGFGPREKWLSSSQQEQNAAEWSPGDDTYSNLIDMNRDGYLDKVDHYNYSTDEKGIWVSINRYHDKVVLNNGGNYFEDKVRWYKSTETKQNRLKWNDGRSRLLDMNGDQRPDRLDDHAINGGSSGLWVYLNSGSIFDVENTTSSWFYSSNTDQNNPTRMGDGDILADVMDMNGDGLPDRVQHRDYVSGQYGLWVAVNTGTGFEEKTRWYYSAGNEKQNRVLWTAEGGSTFSRLIDMNGDGLPDKVTHCDYDNGGGYGLWVGINNGAGIEALQKWYDSPVPEQNRVEWSNGEDIFSQLIDVNGDGRPDRVDEREYESANDEYGLWVSLNNGNGFDSKVRWFDSSGTKQNRPKWVDSDDVKSTLLDINGDGFLDKVDHYNYETSEMGVWVSLNAARPTLLKKVINNFGVGTEISYKPLTDKSVYDKDLYDLAFSEAFGDSTVTIQTPMRVVSSISKDSGIDGAPYVTEYGYAEARHHVRGRGFLGFRVFESFDVQTGLTKTEILRHDFPYTGMKLASMTYGSNGQLLSYAENTLNCKGLNMKPGADGNDHGDYYTLFPFVEKSEEWKGEYDELTDFSAMDDEDLINHLETSAYAHATTTNEFDENGNNLEIFIDYGDGYTQRTKNLYAYDNVAAWFLGRLSSATVTSTAPDRTGQVLSIIRESAFTYDSNGLLWTETIEPGSALSVTTTYTRDNQGRITSTLVDPADDIAITTETHSLLDSTGRFYTKTVNALGHGETRVYDSQRGWVTSQTGPNERTTRFQYDALGRVIREDRPDGTWSETTYEYDAITVDTFEDDRSFTSVYKVTTTASQAPTSVTWYDRLGRVIRSCSEHFEGYCIFQDTGYNALGQADCVSENYKEGTLPTLWTKTTFDDLGRAHVATAPDGTKVKMVYNGRETSTIRNFEGTSSGGANPNANANDQTIKTLLNAKGDKQTVTSYNQDQQPLTVDYHYDGVGNLLETVTTSPTEGTRTISMSYDIRGNKIGMVDPDMGSWSYSYNALGQLETQTDAVGNISSKIYDDLGRITEEAYDAADTNIATVTHKYYYDGDDQFQQLGKLHLETSSTGFRRSHYYDELGRSFLTLSKIEGRWFYQQTDYDSYSRPVRLTHYWRPPSLDEVAGDHHLAWYSYSQETLYDDRSFVTEVRDANGQIWWSNPVYNEFGQLTSYLAGNQLTTENTYDDANHVLKRITVKAGATTRLDHRYDFDSLGNLTQRTDEVKGLTENLFYDNLNRLTSSSVVSGSTLTMTYDDFGNIESRDSTGTLGDVGNYAYAANSNRVSSAGGRSFYYNNNGSITSVTGSSTGNITWAAFNKPYTMESNNKRSAFSYDTGNGRVTQTRETYDIGSSQWLTNSRKTYVGSLFEQEQAWVPATGSASAADQLDRTKWDITSTRIYISTPAGVVGSWISEIDQVNPKKTLFHRDHLGSVIAESDLTDPNGTISKEFSYDAWGLARDASDWDGVPTATPDREATDRGYTGHEMLDDLGLIHMNGRIYDPLLGRMLSADPHIQSPTNLQNYNRYSYVTNNPLSMTDPSGFFFKKLFKKVAKFFKKFAVAIVTFALATVTFGASFSVAGFLAYGAQNAYNAGGIKGLVFFAASIAVTAAIGGVLDPSNILAGGMETLTELSRATAHGIAQGGFAELQGGDFGSSFLAGFSGSITGSLISAKSGAGSYFGEATQKGKYLVRRTIAASVVGGTVAEIGGGKFANGAATAAMVHLFNAEGNHGGALAEGQVIQLDQAELTPGDIRIVEVGITISKPGLDVKGLQGNMDRIIRIVGKVPSRIPVIGSLYEETAGIISDRAFEVLTGAGRSTAFVDLKVQFYEGKNFFGWQKWSIIYTTHHQTPVPSNSSVLGKFTFPSGVSALNGANRFLNNSINPGLLPYNRYRK